MKKSKKAWAVWSKEDGLWYEDLDVNDSWAEAPEQTFRNRAIFDSKREAKEWRDGTITQIRDDSGQIIPITISFDIPKKKK